MIAQGGIGRWFYRCGLCLAVCASTLPYQKLACECGGEFRTLGKVAFNRLTEEYKGAPCDGSCTHARGPQCDCVCGGKYHGSGMVVQILCDRGPIPVALGGSKERAEEFQAAIVAAQARIAAMPGNAEYDAGTWLPYDTWTANKKARKDLHSARGMQVHSLRMKKLAKVAAPAMATAEAA